MSTLLTWWQEILLIVTGLIWLFTFCYNDTDIIH